MARQTNSDERPLLPGAKKRGCIFWGLTACASFVGLVISGLFVLGLLMESGYLLPSEIVAGDTLSDERLEFLRTEVLEEGETTKWFYSAALRSIREDGNLLTDQRVIGYFEDEGEFELDSVRLEDVVGVRALYGRALYDGELIIWGRPWFDEDTGEVYAGDTGSLLLWISEEADLDHRFVVDLLEAAVEAGAELVSVELGGSATDEELTSILDATRFSGALPFEAPPAVVALMPE